MRRQKKLYQLYKPQRMSQGFRPFWRKLDLMLSYLFLALAILFLVSAILTACIIAAEANLQSSFTKAGIDYFFSEFEKPIWLAGAASAALSLALAFYRSKLSYVQVVHANYLGFRRVFMDFWDESKYEPRHLILSRSALFSALYPNAREGDWSVNPDFVKFVNEDKRGFREGMQQLITRLAAPNGEKFKLGCYDIVLWMRQILIDCIPINPLDASEDLGTGQAFTGEKAERYIGLAKDIMHIVSIVNDMGEGFFTDSVRTQYRQALDRLDTVKKESEQLQVYFSNPNTRAWRNALISGDTITNSLSSLDPERRAQLLKNDENSSRGYNFSAFREFNVLEGLSADLANQIDVKRYVYDSFCRHGLASEVAYRELAKKLGLPDPTENNSQST